MTQLRSGHEVRCCLLACLLAWLLGCLVACLVAWLVGWFVGWFVGWLVGWWVGWSVCWFFGCWLVGVLFVIWFGLLVCFCFCLFVCFFLSLFVCLFSLCCFPDHPHLVCRRDLPRLESCFWMEGLIAAMYPVTTRYTISIYIYMYQLPFNHWYPVVALIYLLSCLTLPSASTH